MQTAGVTTAAKFFNTIYCGFPYWGSFGTLYWGKCPAELVGTSVLFRTAEGSAAAVALEEQSWQAEPLVLWATKSQSEWHWAKSQAGWGPGGRGDIRDRDSKASKSLQSPAPLRSWFCATALFEDKEIRKRNKTSLEGEREILKFKGNLSYDL